MATTPNSWFLIATAMVMLMVMAPFSVSAADNNNVYSPCEDATVKISDGFTFGIAFSTSADSFTRENEQLSPCDSRLSLQYNRNNKVAVFRPYVDEISLLTIDSSGLQPIFYSMYMVAFAGRKYAARSVPVFVANNSYIVTSFTLVMEFQKGTLQNFYWKTDGCSPCSGKADFICVDNKQCALSATKCKVRGGPVDCSIGIQLAFSGTDKGERVLNSWYEVSKLRQYSLYALFSNLKDSLTRQFNGFF